MGYEDKESRRHSYYWLKQRGICVKCNSEYAEPGKIHCADCAEYFRIKSNEYLHKPGEKQKIAARGKARYERLKENGLCVQCGKKPAYSHNGHTYIVCYECYIKRRKSSTKYLKEKKNKYWDEQGLCIWCGAERKKRKRIQAMRKLL